MARTIVTRKTETKKTPVMPVGAGTRLARQTVAQTTRAGMMSAGMKSAETTATMTNAAARKRVPSKTNASRIFVILPAHNEAARIAPVIRQCKRQGLAEIIVVDDGSKDDTSAVATKAGATVLTHIINLGKGAAMKTGADYAFSRGATGVIFMDSDGQHKPEELPLFAKRLGQGYDIVFGARRRTREMPLIRRAGNWVITSTVRVFYNLRLTDVTSGYRAVSASAYPKLRWDARDYSVEGEMIARAGKNNLRYTEFQIATIYHDSYKGMTIFDGLKIVGKLIWWRMTH